jgi:hypothetical protein
VSLQQITQMVDFAGRTVVVTGGTGVLDGEVSCALAGVGANVVDQQVTEIREHNS